LEYAEHEPAPALRPFVRCLWRLRAPAGGGVERVLPDGCPELLFNRADPFAGSAGVQPLVMVVGQIPRHIEIRPTGEVDLLGIRFEPAGLHALLGVPMDTLLDERVCFDAVDRRLRRELEDASHRGLAALQHALLERIRPVHSLAAHAAWSIVRGASRVDALGLPARTLERRFRREVGLSPKRLARIVRFHAVVRTLDRGRPPDWAALAVDAGYFDQAHLIRDFKGFAGLTPGAYLRERQPMADLIAGVSDSRKGEPVSRPG